MLDRSFFMRDARIVARDLLGRILATNINGVQTSGRIIETEAYLGAEDMASHAYRGLSRRNRSMFLAGGCAYVYLIYGMYYCFNVVTGEEGEGAAVLIRAIEPLEGIEAMRERRGRSPRNDNELADGPGKLAIALGIGPELDGVDLTTSSRIRIEQGEPVPDALVMATPRIGISKSVEHPWRWVVRVA